MMPKCRENQGPDSGYQSREILNAPTKTKFYLQSHKLLLSSSDTHTTTHLGKFSSRLYLVLSNGCAYAPLNGHWPERYLSVNCADNLTG